MVFEALQVWRQRVVNLRVQQCIQNSFEGVLALKRGAFGLDVSNSILCWSSTCLLLCLKRRTLFENVETKPALFRANTPSKEFLHKVVPASLLFIFSVTLTLTTCLEVNHRYSILHFHCLTLAKIVKLESC